LFAEEGIPENRKNVLAWCTCADENESRI